MEKQDSDDEIDQIITKAKGVSISTKSSIKQSLISAYNWASKGEIYIPGIPGCLKDNYMNIKVSDLVGGASSKEKVHPNEYMHSVYFEPIEETLKYKERSLDEFHIITDRNNIRKINASLTGKVDRYPNFVVLLRIYGENTLVAKREEDIGSKTLGNDIGHEFERVLTQPNNFFSCHLLVEAAISSGSSTIKVLIRSEIDCCMPKTPAIGFNDYSSNKKTSSGLEVKHIKNHKLDQLSLMDMREVKMSGQLKDSDTFQCYISGIPAMVHGVRFRNVTIIQETNERKEQFLSAIDKLQECANKMKKGKTYVLERKDGGQMVFKEYDPKYQKKWFADWE